MRETQTKSINGHKWEVTPYPGMYGLKIQSRIIPFLKGISGIVNGVLKSKSNNVLETDIDIGSLVESIISNIDEEKTPTLIKDILFGARVDGRDVYSDKAFNEIFSANYAELYQGLYFVLQVNFGEVFQMAGVSTENETPAGT